MGAVEPLYVDFQDKLKERERELRKRKEREEQEMERVRLKVRRKEVSASFQALLVETIKDPQVMLLITILLSIAYTWMKNGSDKRVLYVYKL